MLSFPLAPSRAARLLVIATRMAGHRALGGPGSGNFGHAGRPGEVGGSSAMFHGTTQDRIKSIKQHGINPQYSGMSWRQSLPEHVYLTSDLDSAKSWAKAAADHHGGGGVMKVVPAVFKVSVPAEEMQKFRVDTQIPNSNNFQYPGVIKPEWIQEAYVQEGEFSWDRPQPWVKALETRGSVFYVPVLLKVRRDVRELGGPGSGNFGHAGRPGEIGGSASVPSDILAAIHAADGGFTYHAATGEQPKVGYALSLHKDREYITSAKDVTVATLAKYTVKNSDLLMQAGNYLGGWHNPEDGKAYLDVSTIVSTPEEAERLGRAANQLAYFDLKKGRSISIEKTHVKAAADINTDGPREGTANLGRSDCHGEEIDWARTHGQGDRGSQADLDRTLGGPGSGNFGHAGRSGEVGGSVADGIPSYYPNQPWRKIDTPVKKFEYELGIKTEQLSENESHSYLDTVKGRATFLMKDLYSDNKVELHWLLAEKRGAGRAAMEKIVRLADKHGVNLGLWARPLPGQGENEGFVLSKPRLEKFYREFGFKAVRKEGGYSWMERESLIKTLGGHGSGNYGHAGRPGQVGGSASEGMDRAEPFRKIFADKGYTTLDVNDVNETFKKAISLQKATVPLPKAAIEGVAQALDDIKAISPNLHQAVEKIPIIYGSYEPQEASATFVRHSTEGAAFFINSNAIEKTLNPRDITWTMGGREAKSLSTKEEQDREIYRGVFMHEAGHLADAMLNDQLTAAVVKTIFTEVDVDDFEEFVSKKISGYAADGGPQEAAAEVFTAIALNYDLPEELHELRDQVKTLLKRTGPVK